MRTAAALRREHVTDCRVMASREQLREHMPKGGEAAEVGEGRLSRATLEIVKPTTLHLIDTRLTEHRIGDTFAKEVDSQVMRLHEGLLWNVLRELPDGRWASSIPTPTTATGRLATSRGRQEGQVRWVMLLNNDTYSSPLERMKYGVVEAVNEFLVKNGSRRLVFLSLSPRMYCDIALRRDGGR